MGMCVCVHAHVAVCVCMLLHMCVCVCLTQYMFFSLTHSLSLTHFLSLSVSLSIFPHLEGYMYAEYHVLFYSHKAVPTPMTSFENSTHTCDIAGSLLVQMTEAVP